MHFQCWKNEIPLILRRYQTMGIISKVVCFSAKYKAVNQALDKIGSSINASIKTLGITSIHWETGLTRDLAALQNNFGEKGTSYLFSGFSHGDEIDAAILRLYKSKRDRVESAINKYLVATIIRTHSSLFYSKEIKQQFSKLAISILKKTPYSYRTIKATIARCICDLLGNQFCYRHHNIYLEDKKYINSIILFLKQVKTFLNLVPASENNFKELELHFMKTFFLTIEAATHKIEILIKQTHLLEGTARAICIMYGLSAIDIEKTTALECKNNIEYQAAVANNISNIDNYFRDDALWNNLLSLLSQKEIVFNGEAFTIKEAQFLLSTWSSYDFAGKNFIFKLLLAKDGKEKTILVKSVGKSIIDKDQIATGTFKLLGLPTYHVEPYLDFELIEYIPHKLIMFSSKGFFSNGIQMIAFDEFVNGESSLVEQRMRLFGGILAVEYLLGAKDCQMKHVFFADNGGFSFRIDWEFLLDYSDTISGNIYPILKGDEAVFIRMVAKLQNGSQLVGFINQGYLDTLKRAKDYKEEILNLMRQYQVHTEEIEADFTSRVDAPASILELIPSFI
ncbi:MAG: hypothetical protein FD145_651 [Candidatus Saganbacteria bacterium]|uniref:Uncharacterized protein n=1 Tax=Candidatus Saganbacteria bacterium TaxID=2575572 RepID=A0A833L1E1_UNCSA|nr:MAG: hypothetical protein FD145_651 [Candidatus Saganbacteria bacterium]